MFRNDHHHHHRALHTRDSVLFYLQGTAQQRLRAMGIPPALEGQRQVVEGHGHALGTGHLVKVALSKARLGHHPPPLRVLHVLENNKSKLFMYTNNKVLHYSIKCEKKNYRKSSRLSDSCSIASYLHYVTKWSDKCFTNLIEHFRNLIWRVYDCSSVMTLKRVTNEQQCRQKERGEFGSSSRRHFANRKLHYSPNHLFCSWSSPQRNSNKRNTLNNTRAFLGLSDGRSPTSR